MCCHCALLRVEPTGARVALEHRAQVASRTTVVLAGLETGWESSIARAALVVVVRVLGHDELVPGYCERER